MISHCLSKVYTLVSHMTFQSMQQAVQQFLESTAHSGKMFEATSQVCGDVTGEDINIPMKGRDRECGFDLGFTITMKTSLIHYLWIAEF